MLRVRLFGSEELHARETTLTAQRLHESGITDFEVINSSTYLNRIFEKFIKDKLGNLSSWDDDVLEEVQ